MKKLLFFFVLTVLGIKGSTQDPHKIDSLKHLLTNAKEDTISALAIWELCREYIYAIPDSALYYTGLGLELIDDKDIRRKFQNTNNPILYAFETRMYSVSSSALAQQRNDSLAVRMGLKSLSLAEKSKDKFDIQRVYFGLAEVYQYIGEPDIAIDYIRRRLASDTSEFAIISDWATLGSCFCDAQQFDSALYYLRKIDPQQTLPDGGFWPYPHLSLAKTYSGKANYEKASNEYRIAIEYAKQGYVTTDLLFGYLGISQLFRRMGLLDSSLSYAKQSLLLAQLLKLPQQNLEASSILADLYAAKGSIDSSYKYLRTSLNLKDSIFNKEKIKEVQNYTFNEKIRQREMEEQQAKFKSKVKIYVLIGGITIMLIAAIFLVRNIRHKQIANRLLQEQKGKAENALRELKLTQSQLIQSEKMASLGELTAGIAHEIQNPLNFVNNFSEVSNELVDEMNEELVKGDMEEAKAIAGDIKQNLEKINHHGKRADAIVKGMLQHSRQTSGPQQPTDINALVDEYQRLALHGIRAKDSTFNTALQTDFDGSIGNINIIPQDIGRVLLNLYNNAFHAVSEKKKQAAGGYQAAVSVSTRKVGSKVLISVKDNGSGIPQKALDKIFQPFFTTKPTGQGTGLGLSLAYDIVKAHGGELTVETKEGEGSLFIVELPIK